VIHFWLLAINVCPLCALSTIPRLLVPRLTAHVTPCANNRWFCIVCQNDLGRHRDRLFWITLAKLWRNWRSIRQWFIKWHDRASSAIGAESRSGGVDAPGLSKRFAS
jgi:hypothetical protein